jgi:FkbM family methyltransferase
MIEPIQEMYDDLIKNRRNCICINAAISDKVGETVMIGNDPVAGIVETMSLEFKKIWHKHSTVRTVPVIQLKDILSRYHITHVDFLSLDVENGEYNVLKSIDFSTVEFYLICIELDEHDKIKDQNCRDLLIRNGFVFKHRMTINEFWINPNYSRKELLYEPLKTDEKFDGNLIKYGNHLFMESSAVKNIKKSIIEYENKC